MNPSARLAGTRALRTLLESLETPSFSRHRMSSRGSPQDIHRPAVVGEDMVRRGRAGLAFALLLTASFLPFLAEVGPSATVPYTLFGRSSVPNGWGFTAGGETNPGPMLWANEGDTVDLALTREDGVTHWWFLDYNGNSGH